MLDIILGMDENWFSSTLNSVSNEYEKIPYFDSLVAIVRKVVVASAAGRRPSLPGFQIQI